MCNYKYFGSLLTGDKKAFTRANITIPDVPYYKELSVRRIYTIALSNARIKEYLPEGDDVTDKRIDRTFLFTLMNTIDPHFFPQAVNEIE
jgi:hypothetical protein